MGLSQSYDFAKVHDDELKVETKYIEGLPADLSAVALSEAEALAQAGSEFIIQLPSY